MKLTSILYTNTHEYIWMLHPREGFNSRYYNALKDNNLIQSYTDEMLLIINFIFVSKFIRSDKLRVFVFLNISDL